jgi:putative SOS response-associated peptidase YedK
MCGRFALVSTPEELSEHFQLGSVGDIRPHYNIAPSQPILNVRIDEETAGGRGIFAVKWGLVPSWAKDPAIGNRMINARAETAASKPSFRAAMRRRRCLAPASGYFEWKKTGRAKQPWYFTPKDRPLFALAALWERWMDAEGSVIESCAILTTEPNELARRCHNRMPLILNPGDYDRWLDPSIDRADRIEDLLAPFPAERMRAAPVSDLVNNPRNDDPRCIEPLADPEQTDLFQL